MPTLADTRLSAAERRMLDRFVGRAAVNAWVTT
jgi:hypothetical protein